LQTGFKNHANVVRGVHSKASAACLPGACVFHFATGFPGMYPTPQPEGCCDGDELRGVYGGGAALGNVQALLEAAEPADRVRACTAGVVGQLLHFPEAAWPRMMADLDRLEAYEGPRNGRNMYERVRMRVRVLKHMTVTGSPLSGAGTTPPLGAAAQAGSPPSAGLGPGSGAGATATATAAAAMGGIEAGAPADEAEFVTAWTYFCLLDPAAECRRSELVVDGHWRRHMRRGNLDDGADEWADAEDKATESVTSDSAAAASAAAGLVSTPSSSSASSAFSHEGEGAGAMPKPLVARVEAPATESSAAGAGGKVLDGAAAGDAVSGAGGASGAAGSGRYSMTALQRALRPAGNGAA
jgi:hypothetical protein